MKTFLLSQSKRRARDSAKELAGTATEELFPAVGDTSKKDYCIIILLLTIFPLKMIKCWPEVRENGQFCGGTKDTVGRFGLLRFGVVECDNRDGYLVTVLKISKSRLFLEKF